MKVHLCRHAITLPLLLTTTTSVFGGDIIDIIEGTYHTGAIAKIEAQIDLEDFPGTSSASSFSVGATAFVELDDPDLGRHSATASGSVRWGLSATGGIPRLETGVGGFASTESNGLDTYASAGGTLSLVFDVTAPIHALVDSEGTFPSDLYVLGDAGWLPFFIGVSGVDSFRMSPGRYRWDGAAGDTSTGFNSYSSGIFFTLEAQPVPEPNGRFLLGAGLLVLALVARRLQSAQSAP